MISRVATNAVILALAIASGGTPVQGQVEPPIEAYLLHSSVRKWMENETPAFVVPAQNMGRHVAWTANGGEAESQFRELYWDPTVFVEIAAGRTWVDSVGFRDGRPIPYRIRGERRWRVVGDTVWEGTAAWIVVDTLDAVQSFSSRTRPHESGDTLVRFHYVEGPIVSRTIVSDQGQRVLHRTEQGILTGSQTLLDLAGDTVGHSGTVNEHRWEWTRMSAAEAADRAASFRIGGFGGYAPTEADRLWAASLAERDPAVIADAISRWDRSRDPVKRKWLYQELRNHLRGLDPLQEEVVSRAMRAGDTTTAIDAAGLSDPNTIIFQFEDLRARATGQPHPRHTPAYSDSLARRGAELDSLFFDVYLPFLRDRDRALKAGVWHEGLVSTTRRRLMKGGGGYEMLGPAQAEWRYISPTCSEAFCARLEEEGGSDVPGLRGLARIAGFLADGRAGWSVLRDAVRDSAATEMEVGLYRRTFGVHWEDSSRVEMPEPDAPWSEWTAWVNAGAADLTGIALYQHRTGINPIAGLFARYSTTRDDFTRLAMTQVFKALGLDHAHWPVDAIVRDLRSKLPDLQTFALERLERRSSLPEFGVSSRNLAKELEEADLRAEAAAFVMGRPVSWEDVPDAAPGRGILGGVVPTAIVGYPLADAVKAHFADVPWMSEREVQARDPADPGLFLHPSRSRVSAPPLYQLQVEWTLRVPRGGDPGTTVSVAPGTKGKVRVVLLREGDRYHFLWARLEGAAPSPTDLQAADAASGAVVRQPVYLMVTERGRWMVGNRDDRIVPSTVKTRRSRLESQSVAAEGLGRRFEFSPETRERLTVSWEPGAGWTSDWTKADWPAGFEFSPTRYDPWVYDIPSAAPFLSPPEWRAGVSWTDTVSIEAGPKETRLIRLNTIERDSVSGARRLWFVRQDIDVYREESGAGWNDLLGDSVFIRRAVRGRSRGKILFDAERGLSHSGTDTLSLRGELHKTNGDGTTLVTLIRKEAERSFEWVAIDEVPSTGGGFGVVQPYTPVVPPLDPRWDALELGDTAALRALVRDDVIVKRRASDAALQRVHEWYGEGLLEELYAAMRWEHGSIEAAISADDREATEVGTRRIFEFYDDPQRVLESGLDLDAHIWRRFSQVMFAVLYHYDSRFVSLAPETYETLISMGSQLRDPRLQELALLATMIDGSDSTAYRRLSARADGGWSIAQAGVLVAQGATNWPGRGGSNPAMNGPEPIPAPTPDADWREWDAWFSGAGRRVAPSIHVYGRRIGWDPVRGFSDRYLAASTDSAKAVFGAMLTLLAPDAITAEIAASALLSEGPLRELGLTWIYNHPGESSEDDAYVRDMFETSLESIQASGTTWPGMNPVRRKPRAEGQGEAQVILIKKDVRSGHGFPDWIDDVADRHKVEVVLSSDRGTIPITYPGVVLIMHDAFRDGPIRFLSFNATEGPATRGLEGPVFSYRLIRLILVDTPDGPVFVDGTSR